MAETPWSAVRAARSIKFMPDGTKLSHGLKHTLLVLATYYPNIWPSEARLADDLGITRGNVVKRLRALEDAGLIARQYRGRNTSTLYRLRLRTIRRGIASDALEVSPASQEPPLSDEGRSLDWGGDFEEGF